MEYLLRKFHGVNSLSLSLSLLAKSKFHKSFSFLLAILVLGLFFGFSGKASAETKYFSESTGNDTTGNGSISTPWKYIPGMGSSSHGWLPVAGDTIALLAGDTWTGEDVLLNASGSNGSPITLTRYGDENYSDPVIDATGNTLGFGIQILGSSSYLTLDNLKVINAGTYDGIKVDATTGNISNITITNCELSGNARDGVRVTNTGNTRTVTAGLIQGCYSHNNGRNGIGISGTGTSGWQVDRNIVADNGSDGENGQGLTAIATADIPTTGWVQQSGNIYYHDGLTLVPAKVYQAAIVYRQLTKETISCPAGVGDGEYCLNTGLGRIYVSVGGSPNGVPNGIWIVYGTVTGTVFSNNTVSGQVDSSGNADGVGIYIDHGANSSVVKNNSISLCEGAGIDIGGFSTGTEVFNNVVFGNGTNASNATPHGIIAHFRSTGSAIYNNTVYDNGKDGIITTNDAETTARNNIVSRNGRYGINEVTGTLTYDHNDIYGNTTEATGGTPADGGDNITSDSMFVNAGAGNFQLQSSSPSIGAGVTIPDFSTDILGVFRPQGSAWDIGAYEYIASSTKAITVFDFNTLDPAVTGTVTEGSHTIALSVPYGTNVTALVPTITITGASVSPNTGVAQNFTNPVTYTVTAEDASTQAYTVTVAPAATEEEDDNDEDPDDLDISKVKYSIIDNNQIKITFKTNNYSKGTARFGIDKKLKQKEKESKNKKKHTLSLENLLPGTKYYFRLSAEDKHDQEERTKIYSITLPRAKTASKAPTPNNSSTQKSQEETQNQPEKNNTETNNPNPKTCSHTVESGDTLWTIAKKIYGDPTQYPRIIEKNKDKYPDIGSKLNIGQELDFCDGNQNSQTTANNSNNDNSSQPNQDQPQSKPQSQTLRWYNPFSWF